MLDLVQALGLSDSIWLFEPYALHRTRGPEMTDHNKKENGEYYGQWIVGAPRWEYFFSRIITSEVGNPVWL